MDFRDIAQLEEPAFEVFKRALDLVFGPRGGSTEQLQLLSQEARLVYLVWCLDGEVHNGGFDQFFMNSPGNHCDEILSYLKLLNARNSERLLTSAMARFPNGVVPRERAVRWEVWSPLSATTAIEAALRELDEEFYRYEDNLAGLLDEYVRANPDARIGAHTNEVGA